MQRSSGRSRHWIKVRECAKSPLVLLLSSVRTIAKAFKALEKVDAKLKYANRVARPNGDTTGFTYWSSQKSD